jgi:hypothetical protein
VLLNDASWAAVKLLAIFGVAEVGVKAGAGLALGVGVVSVDDEVVVGIWRLSSPVTGGECNSTSSRNREAARKGLLHRLIRDDCGSDGPGFADAGRCIVVRLRGRS